MEILKIFFYMGNLKYFLKLFIFWLIYFLVNRVFFILNYFEDFSRISINELLRIFPKSFALDISFIAYISTVITIILFLNSLFSSKRVNLFMTGIIFWFNAFFIVVSALIIGGEIALYAEWESKLNFKAVSHFSNPAEVFSTATFNNYFTMLVSIFIAVIFVKFYMSFVHQNFETKRYKFKQFMVKVIRLPLVLGVLLFLIRGGAQSIPINISDAYFSKNLIINDVTVNPNWNIIQSILKSKTNFDGNPYKKYTSNEVDDFISSINKPNTSTSVVLDTNRPNIVFIILESWSADNVESIGGLKGVTPYFKLLEKDGLSFSNFYSNGWTSDQAMSSIFSSFPVFPYVAIINQTDKARKLPCLNKSLLQYGYHSSYFFGGQLTYGNIKGYLLSQGFDIVKDELDYKYLPSGALGVHDEYMFSQFKDELNALPQPFMSALFTLSSHSPFDFPGEHMLSFNSKEDKYVNSVAYTDRHLGSFINSVKTEDWYSNTLFVIVADHSHSSPIRRRLAEKERFKIPMLWFGEVLKEDFKGTRWDKLGSHIDITPTILAQLGKDNNSYKFGKDIFNEKNEVFVPYAFPKGYGLISNEGYYAFSEGYNKVLELEVNDTTAVRVIKKQAEMYFQAAFNDYMSY